MCETPLAYVLGSYFCSVSGHSDALHTSPSESYGTEVSIVCNEFARKFTITYFNIFILRLQ